MTWVLFFVIGISGGSAQFASQEMCTIAGKELKEKFSPPVMAGSGPRAVEGSINVLTAVPGPRVEWFCIGSGFKVP